MILTLLSRYNRFWIMSVKLPLIQLIRNTHVVMCMAKMVKVIMDERTDMAALSILLILSMIRGVASPKCNVRQGWTNFFLAPDFLWRAILLTHLIGHARNGCSKRKSDQGTTRNITFCSFFT